MSLLIFYFICLTQGERDSFLTACRLILWIKSSRIFSVNQVTNKRLVRFIFLMSRGFGGKSLKNKLYLLSVAKIEW